MLRLLWLVLVLVPSGVIDEADGVMVKERGGEEGRGGEREARELGLSLAGGERGGMSGKKKFHSKTARDQVTWGSAAGKKMSFLV